MRLSAATADQVITELRTSCHRMTEEVGDPGGWFAYPFGSISDICERSFRQVREVFEFCVSGIRGANRSGSGPAVLRDVCRPEWPVTTIAWLLRGGLDAFYRSRARRLQALAHNR
jgi:hypothetical protein